MMNIVDLKEELSEGNADSLIGYLGSDGQPNDADPEWNCPLIFYAVLGGSLEATRILVEAGTNINIKALHPGATILAESVLSLAMQQRHLQDSDLYDPIVEYLIKNGAKE